MSADMTRTGDFEPTADQIELTARRLFGRSKEGRDGFSWPLNGSIDRQRDLDAARAFLVGVLTPPPDVCPACGHSSAKHHQYDGDWCYFCNCNRQSQGCSKDADA